MRSSPAFAIAHCRCCVSTASARRRSSRRSHLLKRTGDEHGSAGDVIRPDNYEMRCASWVRDLTSSLRKALRRWYLDGAWAYEQLSGQSLLLLADVSNENVGRLSVSSSRDGNIVALEMWDDEALHLLAARQVQVARDAGALVHLQFALSFLARSHMLGERAGSNKCFEPRN
jgi:hypothetical protein